jgi:hypothetical protein
MSPGKKGQPMDAWSPMEHNEKLILSDAREAKAIVLLAFRNGPIEDVHAGKTCPTCHGEPKYSHITEAEMKTIMKTAVDRVFELLKQRRENPIEYLRRVAFSELYTSAWDEPQIPNPPHVNPA